MEIPLAACGFRFRSAALLLAASLAPASRSMGQMPFGAFGSRQMGLGGATLGVVDGVTSAVDNPAAVGKGHLEASLAGDLVALESGDVLSPLRLISGNNPLAFAAGLNPSSAADVKNALISLSEPGNGLLGDARAGLIVSWKEWALYFLDRRWSGVYARTDLVHVLTGFDPATSWKNNTSSVAFRGLEVKDLALARSFSFFAGAVSLGASAHALFGTTYTKEESVFTTDVSSAVPFARRSFSGVSRSETQFSLDAGAFVTLGIVRVGGTVIALNRPGFSFDDSDAAPPPDRGQKVFYGRQGRIGASVKIPVVGLLLAVDYDLTKNETLVPGLFSRVLGGGVEFRILVVQVRAGVKVNLESPDRTTVLSGGAGFVLGPVNVDVGAIYRPDTNDVGLSLGARASL